MGTGSAKKTYGIADGHGHSMWLMMLACLVPIAIFAIAPYFGWKNNALLTLIAIGAMILVHVVMMYGMRHGKGAGHRH
ncbi:hypothetical protein HYV81_04455 [Candidatus Woesearchaeota archaeon]|nr:hypothetical protein [Candidatus Woesearchaeota archaeon]